MKWRDSEESTRLLLSTVDSVESILILNSRFLPLMCVYVSEWMCLWLSIYLSIACDIYLFTGSWWYFPLLPVSMFNCRSTTYRPYNFALVFRDLNFLSLTHIHIHIERTSFSCRLHILRWNKNHFFPQRHNKNICQWNVFKFSTNFFLLFFHFPCKIHIWIPHEFDCRIVLAWIYCFFFSQCSQSISKWTSTEVKRSFFDF